MRTNSYENIYFKLLQLLPLNLQTKKTKIPNIFKKYSGNTIEF